MSRKYPYLTICPGCGLNVLATRKLEMRGHNSRRRAETDYPGPCPTRAVGVGPYLSVMIGKDGAILEQWTGTYSEKQMIVPDDDDDWTIKPSTPRER